METFKRYIDRIDFDRIELYRINGVNNISCVFRLGNYELFDENGNPIPNGILGSDGNINSAAKNIGAIDSEFLIEEFKGLFGKDANDYYDCDDKPLYKSGLLFYKNQKIVKGINISLGQFRFLGTDNVLLKLNKEDFEKLRIFLYRNLGYKYEGGIGYYGKISQKWREHLYPSSFFFNPYSEVYEAQISSPIFHSFHNSVRVEVQTSEKFLSRRKLTRLEYIRQYPLYHKMLSKVLELYNDYKEDFELPEINGDIDEILPFFVELREIVVPENDDEDILLSFTCWDEEHGLRIRINDKDDKIELE